MIIIVNPAYLGVIGLERNSRKKLIKVMRQREFARSFNVTFKQNGWAHCFTASLVLFCYCRSGQCTT